MKYSNQSYNIRIELDTQNCELSAAEITQVEESLSPLRELVETRLNVRTDFNSPMIGIASDRNASRIS